MAIWLVGLIINYFCEPTGRAKNNNYYFIIIIIIIIIIITSSCFIVSK